MRKLRIFQVSHEGMAKFITYLRTTKQPSEFYDHCVTFYLRLYRVRTFENRDTEDVGYVLWEVGKARLRIGELEKGLECQLKAFEIISETLKDGNPGKPNYLDAIGNTYKQLGRWEEALQWYQRSLEVKEKSVLKLTRNGVRLSYYIARDQWKHDTLQKISEVYFAMGDKGKGEEYARKHEEFIEKTKRV